VSTLEDLCLDLRMLQVLMVTVVLSAGLAVVPTMAAGTTQTFTGKVSDAMCGAKHTEGLAPAACVRACVQKGAKYALVVGDKVYTLDTSDQATLDNLNKLAWEQAKVTGTADGDHHFGEDGHCCQVGRGRRRSGQVSRAHVLRRRL
jgi:hypothetical protein